MRLEAPHSYEARPFQPEARRAAIGECQNDAFRRNRTYRAVAAIDPTLLSTSVFG